jgi:hypothetical protein
MRKMETKKFIRNAKPEDCGVVRGRKSNPVVMEVVGSGGIKVAEYVDKGKDSLPYQQLHEKVVM